MQQNTINAQILKLAIPSIISNITVPLLGLVDMSITGHLGSEIYIGAISVGGTIFSMIYWIFNFLRFGTGSQTSRALGMHRIDNVTLALVRALIVASTISLILIVLQNPILKISMSVVNASQAVKQSASQYFSICIYGSFGMLGSWCLLGWFVGMQNTKIPLLISVVQNIVNIILSLIFVYLLGMQVRGVALGTMCSQIFGLVFGIILWFKFYGKLKKYIDWHKVFMISELTKFFKLNSAIFFRTICVVAVTVYFTIAGAELGDQTLAANAVLMQFFMLYTYFIDGFAYSAEAICGKYFGSGNQQSMTKAIRQLFKFGWIVGLGFAVCYLIGGKTIISLLTDQTNVVNLASKYLIWIIILPLCAVDAFIWDGIYVGAGKVFSMFVCCLVAMIVFFVVWFLLKNNLGNNALWLAFDSYLIVRGIVLWLSRRQLKIK